MGNGGFFKSLLENGLLIFFRASEENNSWLLLSKNCLNFILGEFENGWDHEWLNEFNKGILIGFTSVCVLFSFEFSEEYNTISRSTMSLTTLSIRVNENNFIFGVGIWDMSSSVKGITNITEISNDEFACCEFLSKSGACNFGRWWA